MSRANLSLLSITTIIWLSGCSFSKSSICNSDEIGQTLTDMARQEKLLFEEMRSATAQPPYTKDPNFRELKMELQQKKQAIDNKTITLNQNIEKCRQIEDGGSGYLGALIALGSAMSSDLDNQTAAACSGDFSFYRKATSLVSGEEMFAMANPNRHRFWRRNVRSLSMEIDQLSQSVSELESRIQKIEYNNAIRAYSLAKMYINSASLEFSNKEDTVHTCSAFLNVEANGWSPVQSNVNYEVKITDDGGRKVVLKIDSRVTTPRIEAYESLPEDYN